MLKLTAIFGILLLATPLVHAGSGDELLTYQELIGLSPAPRAQYIKNVRKLMLELEKLQLEQEREASASRAPQSKPAR